MSGHTSGPWEAILIDDGIMHSAIYCKHDPIGTKALDIAAVWRRGGDKKAAANARLIAAAPDLLEVAKLALRMGQYGGVSPSTVEDAARAAIAKATGEQL